MRKKVITYDLETSDLVTKTSKEKMSELLTFMMNERKTFKKQNLEKTNPMENIVNINSRYGYLGESGIRYGHGWNAEEVDVFEVIVNNRLQTRFKDVVVQNIKTI